MGRFCFVTLSLQILRPDGADSDSDKIIPTNITPPWGDSFSRLIPTNIMPRWGGLRFG
jgi:hypothetical protein